MHLREGGKRSGPKSQGASLFRAFVHLDATSCIHSAVSLQFLAAAGYTVSAFSRDCSNSGCLGVMMLCFLSHLCHSISMFIHLIQKHGHVYVSVLLSQFSPTLSFPCCVREVCSLCFHLSSCPANPVPFFLFHIYALIYDNLCLFFFLTYFTHNITGNFLGSLPQFISSKVLFLWLRSLCESGMG